MGWIKMFSVSRVVGANALTDPYDPRNGTAVNAKWRGARKAIQRNAENSVARSGVSIPEEIKRRQTALMVRYITTVCAR
jgi:hypothetical protein